jgi:single-strand DNA-binding protein
VADLIGGMDSMNECIFMGNLTRDVQVDKVGKSSVAKFTIAVSRKYKKASGEAAEEVAYLDMEAWDSGGETIAKWFKKGSRILVTCSVKQENWDDKETGKKRSRYKFRVNQFFFPNSKRDDGEPTVANTSLASNDGTSGAEEDIPF